MVPAYLVQSLANRRWSKRTFKMKGKSERRAGKRTGKQALNLELDNVSQFPHFGLDIFIKASEVLLFVMLFRVNVGYSVHMKYIKPPILHLANLACRHTYFEASVYIHGEGVDVTCHISRQSDKRLSLNKMRN